MSTNIASVKTQERLQQLSEKYNKPKDHLEVMLMIGTVDATVASYQIDVLQNTHYLDSEGVEKRRYPVCKEDFILNLVISRDPKRYFEEAKKNEGSEVSFEGVVRSHFLTKFKKEIEDNKLKEASLTYLILCEFPKFEETFKQSAQHTPKYKAFLEHHKKEIERIQPEVNRIKIEIAKIPEVEPKNKIVMLQSEQIKLANY